MLSNTHAVKFCSKVLQCTVSVPNVCNGQQLSAKYLPAWTLNVRRRRNPKQSRIWCEIVDSQNPSLFCLEGRDLIRGQLQRNAASEQLPRYCYVPSHHIDLLKNVAFWDTGQFLKSFNEYDYHFEVWICLVHDEVDQRELSSRWVAKMDCQQINQFRKRMMQLHTRWGTSALCSACFFLTGHILVGANEEGDLETSKSICQLRMAWMQISFWFDHLWATFQLFMQISSHLGYR